MASAALLRRMPSPVLSSSHPLPRLSLQPHLRVVRIRVFAAGEGGAPEKEEEAGSSSSSTSTKGFGAPAKPASKKKGATTIRRTAPEKPLLQSAPKENQVSQLETAYVVALASLFGLIFVEGIALAASGFLPEEWDQFFVNTLYPSFTPTVGLFLLFAAGYGVFKFFGLDGTAQK